MAKRSKRLVLWFLLLVLLYFALLRWKVKVRLSPFLQSNIHSLRRNSAVMEETKLPWFHLRRLAQGKDGRHLRQYGVSCITDPDSDICIISGAVRIAAATPTSPPTVYLAAGQRLPPGTDDPFLVRPYPRKTDTSAMARTSPVHILSAAGNSLPPCDVTHSASAVVFSTGGYAGNFFHNVNDVLIPLFLTAGLLRPLAVRLVAADFEPWWAKKYRKVLSALSTSKPVVISSPSVPIQPQVHCFPAAVVGLKYHGNLNCDATKPPGGLTILDFRRFLRHAFALQAPRAQAGATRDHKPVLVLISRHSPRALLNEAAAAELAEAVGFRVEIAAPGRVSKVEGFAGSVNRCDVLMGVHGAGLANMVFLRPGAVVLQVVPWGLDWASAAYFGRPAAAMGLRYVEYRTAVEESTLYDAYPKGHTVLVDPWAVHRLGYNVSRPIYTDGQNLRLDLTRFRETLEQAYRLVSRAVVQWAARQSHGIDGCQQRNCERD